MRTHFKPTETFQYTFFTTFHSPGAKKGFVKVEAPRLLKTNSSNKTFEEKTKQLKKTLPHLKKHRRERDYPQKFVNKTLSELTQALPQRNKEILTKKWYLIQQQPLLNQIFKKPPMISHRNE